MMIESVVEIYTDGACSGNPGHGGWGVLLKFRNTTKEIYGFEFDTTNNRMELLAAIKGLEALNKNCKVRIYTDSKYLQDGITKWIHQWIKNNWRKSDNRLVKNADLWQNLYELTQKYDITWEWVKGHSSNLGNQVADKLACIGKEEAKRKSRLCHL
jgi:ribonuclease HI